MVLNLSLLESLVVTKNVLRSAVAQWLNVGLRSERSGGSNFPPPFCVFEQDTLLPESTVYT